MLPRKYVLVWFVVANLDTEVPEGTDGFPSDQSDEMYLGQVISVRGNEYSLLYYILTQMRRRTLPKRCGLDIGCRLLDDLEP